MSNIISLAGYNRKIRIDIDSISNKDIVKITTILYLNGRIILIMNLYKINWVC